MDFGFTKDLNKVIAAREFGLAAEKDGWNRYPTYSSESVDRVSSLEREGFKMMILSRENDSTHEAQVNIWGPDGMVINPPETYNWELIKAVVTTCNLCGINNVKTYRYSFAGRACSLCLSDAKRATEYLGWAS